MAYSIFIAQGGANAWGSGRAGMEPQLVPHRKTYDQQHSVLTTYVPH